MSQRLLAEFVGTFTLIFIGAGSIIAVGQAGGAGAGLVTVAIAYGLATAAMVSATGHVSGGHINPAVTIGAWVTQKISSKDAIGYIVAQVAGGVAAAGVIRAAIPEAIWRSSNLGTPLVSPSISNGQAILIEAVLTFFLVWVVFGTAVDPEGAFGKIAGLAIGFVVIMGVMMGWPFSGAAMNPARSIGPALVGGFFDGWWVYWIGPIAGGVLAASLYDSGILRPHLATPVTEPAHGVGAHGEEGDHVVPEGHEHE